MSKNVGVIVGSVHKQSLTRRVAQAIQAEAPEDLNFTEIPIGHLGFYDQSLETETPPTEWAEVRNAVQEKDAILFATPEYNRSVSGVLKNAVDVLSRPYGKAAVSGKPSAIISASPGGIGGFGANQHLRTILSALNTPLLPGPEMYLGGVNGDWFDSEGRAANDGTRRFLAVFGERFAEWIDRFAD